jgi:hypothetical protein
MKRPSHRGVTLTIAAYEEIRAGSNMFFVLPGHEVPAVEEVMGEPTTSS